MSDGQRADSAAVFVSVEGGGLLDFVAAWYVLAAQFIKGTRIRCAFVSTNSIVQGEQVGILWGWLLFHGIRIHFAHRTFRWSNDARGVAAVHCVIVGFGAVDAARKTIFEYDDVRGDPHPIAVQNINPYLVDAPNVVLPRRTRPICAVPEIGIGNKPIDGGNYLFSTIERDEFVRLEPSSRAYFRRWLGAEEFINGYERWCLWLGDCEPAKLREMPQTLKRVDAVRKFREASKSEPTRRLAQIPTRFHVECMPKTAYLAIAKVSSERRFFVPVGFLDAATLSSDLLFVSLDSTLYHFGVVTSTMHNAWIRYTCGRLESRYRYSKDIVYNNFPWPDSPTAAQKQKVESAAQGVLDARAAHPNATLADLYDPLTMPSNLVKAHQVLDAAVDAAYGRKGFTKNDAGRVAFLFELYQKYTSLLPSAQPAERARKRINP